MSSGLGIEVGSLQYKEIEKLGHRAYTIEHYNQVRSITGYDRLGNLVEANIEYPSYTLTPQERIEIYRRCALVLGIVSRRMNLIGSLEITVSKNSYLIENKISGWKHLKSIYDDFKNSQDQEYQLAAGILGAKIRSQLPDCLPDLSNFSRAITRYNKIEKSKNKTSADQIADFLYTPNNTENFSDFVKKYVNSLLIHGHTGIHKKYNPRDNTLLSLHILPGGTVFPIRTSYTSNYAGLVQHSYETSHTNILYPDECIYDIYLPISDSTMGVIPLESVINKVTEELFQEQYWSEQADGTRPIEKLLAISNRQLPGGFEQEGKVSPMEKAEKERMEQAVMQSKKNAITVVTGLGDIAVHDISKENIGDLQLKRKEAIIKDIAAVFNATPLEMNQTGSEGTSGRSTAEAQLEEAVRSGSYPIIKSIQDALQTGLIDPHFGSLFEIEFSSDRDDKEKMEAAREKVDSGIFSVNEVRMSDFNEEPFDEVEYDYPKDKKGDKLGTIQEALKTDQ